MPPRAILRDLSDKISQLMSSKGMSAKELAKKSGIVYSTLIPILNGSRDCGVTKLAAIAEALECTPNDLLFYKHAVKNATTSSAKGPSYLAVFISQISVTYCLLYDCKTHKTTQTVMQFSLNCGRNQNEFIDHLVLSIRKLTNNAESISFKNIAVFVSVQKYELANNRKKIQDKGEHLFNGFIVESDAQTNYRALVKEKNAICVSINDGDAILFSTDKGKIIHKIQGYGFPISDIAGNYWIGCEAIKHVVNVKENLEPSSPLSDKISAAYNDDINAITENVLLNPELAYSQASSIVKELIHKKQKAHQIAKESANLLLARIEIIDKDIEKKLPILITGDLAYIYEGFFPENRLIKLQGKHDSILMKYGVSKLKDLSEPGC